MGHDSTKHIICVLIACLLFGAILYFTLPNSRNSMFRSNAQNRFMVITEADLPGQIENREENGRIHSIRRPANNGNIQQSLSEAVRFINDSELMVSAANIDRKRVRVLSPLIDHDGSGQSPLSLPVALEAGEIFDGRGRPLRWNTPDHMLASYNVPRPNPFPLTGIKQNNSRFSSALARLAPSGKASDYRNLVDSFARRYNLNTNLVMAIIHSESNFSPSLISNKSAMGLMQLLPSTASDEVHRFLYGKRGHVNFEQLSNPEINIRYGTAYLHILNNRYFAAIKDPQIREACVIASYNMGPNGFLKLYGPAPAQAIARINQMSSDEFHADLPRRLPVRETRFYVEKVRRMKQQYAGME